MKIVTILGSTGAFYRLVDEIWAGPYPDRIMIPRLVEQGVRTFVNLTRWDERLLRFMRAYKKHLPNGTKHLNFPLWTYSLPPVEQMLHIVDAVEGHSPTYLHCRHGLDRTGVTAVLILMKRGMALQEALEHIATARGNQPQPSPRNNYHFRYLANAAKILAK
ncbi:MAG: tyrosine-protein phosphatase [Thermodesulfobacteriota bacterium]